MKYNQTRFLVTISSIKQLKKYKPQYILTDKVYDTEPIRQTINEYVGAYKQIPLKTHAKIDITESTAQQFSDK